MKNYRKIFSIALAVALFGAITSHAVADPDWPKGMGPGMMSGGDTCFGMGMEPEMMRGRGGYGMGRGMMGMGGLRGLNLNEEQKSKIGQIRKEMQKKHWSLMEEMMDARDKLDELYDAEKQDAAAINKQYKVIEDLRRQMVESSVDAHNKINSLLSKEQREKFQERRHAMMMWDY